MQESLPREWIDTPLVPTASDLGYPDVSVDVHVTHNNAVQFGNGHPHATIQGSAVDLSEYR
jgi:hypothetical protein